MQVTRDEGPSRLAYYYTTRIPNSLSVTAAKTVKKYEQEVSSLLLPLGRAGPLIIMVRIHKHLHVLHICTSTTEDVYCSVLVLVHDHIL
jgi:hypothetical protein